jgi:hypothetical protein
MAREKPAAGWKVALFASGAFAILFVAIGGISTGYSLRNIVVLALVGALLGAIAAPELEPKAFPHAIVWQMFFGILGGLLMAYRSGFGPLGYSLSILGGAAAGYFARYWTPYINPP